MLASFWPRLQNAHAISIDITTVLPLPVAIFAAMRRSGMVPFSGDGSIRRGKNSWPAKLNDGRSPQSSVAKSLSLRAGLNGRRFVFQILNSKRYRMVSTDSR